MTRFVYATATTIDGFLADDANSLDWLFVVDGGQESLSDLDVFVQGVGVMVEGSTTYRWVVEHEGLMGAPGKWQEFYGDRIAYVFSSRADLPLVPGADIRVVSGPVIGHLPAIREAAAGQDVWLMGGGDLVGQFDEAGALDEVWLSVAPVTLGSGAPLLSRRIESDRLRLAGVAQTGQFASLKYKVRR